MLNRLIGMLMPCIGPGIDMSRVLQTNGWTCGPVALYSVALYHDLDVSLDQIMDVCGIDEEGMTNRNMSIAARAVGLKAKWVEFSLDALRKEVEAGRPVIVTRFDVSEDPHFSVVRGVDNGLIYFCDPSLRAQHKMRTRDAGKLLENRMLVMAPKS